MPDLTADPRTARAYANARARAHADPQLGLPEAVGPPIDLLLRTLSPTEPVRWFSWAYELGVGHTQWWVIALTAKRLIGVSPSLAPKVWAVPAGSWSAADVDGDAVLSMSSGPPLRVRGVATGDSQRLFRTAAATSPTPIPATAAADVMFDHAHEVPVANKSMQIEPDASGTGTSAASASDRAVISGWQEAEALAGWHMKKIGFTDAALTASGADGGIDVAAADAVAQVKHYAKVPIGAPAVQQLRGAAIGRDWALFYSWSGFTRSAIEYANTADVALFTYDERGAIEPASNAATHLTRRAGVEEAPNIGEFELERSAKKLSQEYFDKCFAIFTEVIGQALGRATPNSHLHLASQVELARVKEVVADVGSRTVPLSEFLEKVESINEATRRLSADLGIDSQV